MSNSILTILLLTIFTAKINADCFLCEEINERNRNLPPPKFKYYEDYLEDLKKQQQELPEKELEEISFEHDEQ